MVEPTKQPLQRIARKPDAAPSDKRVVLTIGDVGHGKSTFNNALIGAHKNEASDATSGVTQNFQTYSSILPEFKDTAFIDSPGLNDPDMALENWVQKYNNTVGKQSAPRLSLVVLLIECQARPTLAACVELAALLSCVTKLRAQNFAVVINKCAPRYTPAKAIEFFQQAVQTLEDSAQKSFFSLTEREVLLILDVNQDEVNQEAVEKSIRPSVVKFISEKLKQIPPGSVLEQRQTTSSQIFDKTGDAYREKLVKMQETIAKQAKSIDDLRKAMEEAESLRRKNEQRLREEASLKQQEIERRLAEEKKEKAQQISQLTSALASVEGKMSELLAKQEGLPVKFVKDYIFTCTNGVKATYTGDMVGQKKHGRGTARYSDGQVYDGEFKDGLYHGRGTYRWPDGTVYDGEYKDDKRNGRGTYRWPDGKVYDGEFKDDNRNGRGTYRWPCGQVYDGEYKDDKINGRGTFRWPDGTVYDGEWKDGLYHGRGTLRYANGRVEKGIRENDKLVIEL